MKEKIIILIVILLLPIILKKIYKLIEFCFHTTNENLKNSDPSEYNEYLESRRIKSTTIDEDAYDPITGRLLTRDEREYNDRQKRYEETNDEDED